MKKFLLTGEPLGLFIAREEAPLEEVGGFDFAVAGAELNVAIGLSRLGHSAAYMTKLGDDLFARRIINVMQKNNLDASLIEIDKTHTTGFMFKGRVSVGDPPILYCRRGSAASRITADDYKKINFSEFDGGFLHITGISAALSENAPDNLIFLMKKAKENGMTVSFDPNLRPQLWKDTETMTEALNEIAYNADIVLPGYKEGKTLIGTDNPEKIADYYMERGVKAVIVKLGARGAFGAYGNEKIFSPAFKAEKIVDTVGAGDGFAAGVISAFAEDLPLSEALRRGNAIGTIQIMSVGDNDGLPTRRQLDDFTANTETE